jgi:hypothetical protein
MLWGFDLVREFPGGMQCFTTFSVDDVDWEFHLQVASNHDRDVEVLRNSESFLYFVESLKFNATQRLRNNGFFE